VPVIHIFTPEGFVSPARKKAMIENVTRAAVEAEGLPTTDRTYVLVHEVADGGWGWQGAPITKADFEQYLPPDPAPAADPTDEAA
jgi:phenylpyruvate tautomerase PptA (4-oxalocrotonate tautomerase family)